jgi:hypothetical protein
MVRLGDVQLVFEPTDDAVAAVKGGGTQVLRTPLSMAPPAPAAKRPSPSPAAPVPPKLPVAAAPKAPAPAPPKARPPVAKPVPKRPAPVAQQPPPKKGKGCGASAAVLVIGSAGLAVLVHRLLLS